MISCLMTSFISFAINSKSIEEQSNNTIKELYHTLSTMPNTSMPERIDWISAQFKGKPYLLGALGEGPNAYYDQFPLYRTDAFDCDTYVNTILALALANSLKSFQQCLQYARYHQGKISYQQRNHFTSLDWNINNQKRGLLKDVTLNIKNKQNKSVAKCANAWIDKANWYNHANRTRIRLQNKNIKEQEHRLAKLKENNKKYKIVQSNVPYIPLSVLFPNKDSPDLYLFSQIPQGAIIEIVRPNWDLSKEIGTHLNVSHLGFAIWKKNQLYFREASSEFKAVVDISLIDYLKKALKSPTIKGINIQVVLPQKPVNEHCDILNKH